MKCTIKIDWWGSTPKTQRADRLIEEVRSRCAVLKTKPTIWLVFDYLASRDSKLRDSLLAAFRKYARTFDKPRSIAEGAKWLAYNAEATDED